MAYAARDAQVSVALFFHLLDLLPETDSASACGSLYEKLARRCQGLVDVPFKSQINGDTCGKKRKSRNHQFTLLAVDSPDNGEKRLQDPRRSNQMKPLRVGYSAR